MQENEKRWIKAQRSELNWWAHFRELPFYRNHSFEQHWSERISALGIRQSDFAGKNIVEVGCGPYGVVSYAFPDARKIGIDPLIRKYQERAAPMKNTLLISGIGENLPIRSNVADMVLCINVIDHVISASRVLLEIHRILKKSAPLILEVHTFPGCLVPIMAFDHPHTYHWTRRRLIKLLQDCRFKVERIEVLKFEVPISLRSHLNPAYWKYLFGNWFMKLTYGLATKP